MTHREQIKLLDEFFTSDQKSRKTIVDTITGTINSYSGDLAITPEELYLSIDEAITNAMEHGNKWDPNKKIHVEISGNSTSILISITDEGEGFDSKNIKDKLKKRDILSTRGRGIYIINQFCTMKWNEKGNSVILTVTRKN